MLNIIYQYTRAQALEDGVLIDVSEIAAESGFKYPTAVTAAVWNDYISWDDNERAYQDEAGRLWDVVYMASIQLYRYKGSEAYYNFYSIPRGKMKAKLAKLKMVISAGDTPEPVITIMLPTED